MSLPQFMVLKSVSGKYLRYGKGKGSTLSSLTFSHKFKRQNLDVADSLESLKKKKNESEETPVEFNLIKFEVQEAKNAPGYVHIRTSYNNKYLVRKSEESKSIVAEAHEAEEDQSKWSCTLFKPIFLGEADEAEEEGGFLFGNKHGIGMVPQKIQLVHVVNGEEEYYVSVESMELVKKKKKEESMIAATTLITVSDMTPTAILPEHLTIKSHDGSKYVGSPNWSDIFFRYSDVGDQGVAMVSPLSDGTPTNLILGSGSLTEGGVWKVNQNNDVGLAPGYFTRFCPIKVDKYVVLYATDNGKFVHRNPDSGGVSANSSTITEEAQLMVGEPVVSRTILSITYDLDNARVYDTTDVTKITDSRTNNTDDQETGTLEREFTMSRTMSWNQSMTVSVGMSMGMSFGVPEVGMGGEVSLNFDISETCEWGQEVTSSETITHTYDFNVPPHTKQTKTVVASKSSCDVPFTCEVLDIMTDGIRNKYTKTDCWFTGANDYNANEVTDNEPAPSY